MDDAASVGSYNSRMPSSQPEITVAAITESGGRFLVVEERMHLLPLLNAVAGHHGPLEGRRLETPEAVALYQANQLDARIGESLAAAPAATR